MWRTKHEAAFPGYGFSPYPLVPPFYSPSLIRGLGVPISTFSREATIPLSSIFSREATGCFSTYLFSNTYQGL